MTKVLLIGKDGRTDALATALTAGGATLYAMCDYRHPGLRRKASRFHQGKTDNPQQVVDFARAVKPDLAVIGPEDPLAAGVVDELDRVLGVPSVGPPRALARLESSKSFTRRLLTEFDLPGNVDYQVFTSMEGVETCMRRLGEFVVKPDGLTGGKGVKVFGEHLPTLDAALAYTAELLPAGPVVIEERLEGEEFSLQSFCDGDTVVDTIPVQDHKRAWDGDTGPNTGGMGSYSCADHGLPFLGSADLAAASRMNAAVARALREKTGAPYRGVLYGGFMVTATGVRLLEYNARMGDPEALNVLSLLDANFVTLCEAIVAGTLRPEHLRLRARASVCKYVVPKNYPTAPIRGAAIDLDRVPAAGDDLALYLAAVQEAEDGRLLLLGSRAVGVVGLGETVAAAEVVAEYAAQRVDGPVEHRRDIGSAALLDRRVAHMSALRSG